jgi:hypothetical protein
MQGRNASRCCLPALLAAVLFAAGCRSTQHAHVLSVDENDMVGNRTAGAETFKPLIDEAMGKLLARHEQRVRLIGLPPHPLSVCFVAVENKSAEELTDFKDQIYEHIDTRLSHEPLYRPISKRFVDAGLRETRLRPDQLFLPDNLRMFTAVLEQQGQPVNYLLYATITSGTTSSGKDYQRDYLLTLEMINVNTGDYDKESATIRKGYHKSVAGKWWHYGKWW